MLCATLREAYEQRLEEIAELLPILHETYKSLAAQEISQYTFDSAEARQEAKRVKIAEIKEQIDALQSEQAQLIRKLAGGGVVNMNLRRKPYIY